MTFDDVEIPFDLVVGEDAGWNNGWSMLAGPALEVEKIAPTACAVGIAAAALGRPLPGEGARAFPRILQVMQIASAA
ncbi:MAG: hypothetical protein M0R03_05985 [Novosphingobium sp.]|nr:hypothetical protein [Novosphingobium sp.]